MGIHTTVEFDQHYLTVLSKASTVTIKDIPFIYVYRETWSNKKI